MLDFPTWKKTWLWLIAAVAMFAALPSLFAAIDQRWPDALPDPTVNLGLDLAGGSHILLEAEPAQVAAQRLESMEEGVRTVLQNAEPRIRIGDVSTADGRLSFMIDDAGDVDRARELLLPLVNGQGMVREWDLTVVDETRFVLTPTESGLEQAVSDAMDSATEVVRRRIDALGTREPTIIRQGDTRIVVQVPGLDDPDQPKELLGQTARPAFRVHDATAPPTGLAPGTPPPARATLPTGVPPSPGANSPSCNRFSHFFTASTLMGLPALIPGG